MSGKLNKKEDIGIAFVNEDYDLHRGTYLTSRFVKELHKKLKIYDSKNASKLYAICIFNIIQDYINNCEELIICNDENFEDVEINFINLCNHNNISLTNCNVISISQYRDRENLPDTFESLADKLADKYRLRAKNECRWEEGTKIYPVKTTIGIINTLWNI